MVRWLLAVFTLQFLLGIGVSAFAQAAPAPAPAVLAAVAPHALLAAPAAEAAAGLGAPLPAQAQLGEPAAPEAPGDSGVDFSGSDLPDDQEFWRPAAWRLALPFPWPRLAGPPPASRPLHPHLRPPRA